MSSVTIQRLRLVVPPTLAELLEDDVYAAWFRRNPVMPSVVPGADAWQVIGRRVAEAQGATWAVARVPSYADAYRRARRMLKDPQWEDVAACSRAVMFRPPVGFSWATGRFGWCGRCRRPTLFREMKIHPVLRGQLDDSLRRAIMVSKETPERCYYCGMSRAGMPRYKPRRRG